MAQAVIGGQSVAAAQEPPECEAFRRCGLEEFKEVEHTVAQRWRNLSLGFKTTEVIKELVQFHFTYSGIRSAGSSGGIRFR